MTRVRLSSDAHRILWAQALRAFAYGFGAVLLGSTLGWELVDFIEAYCPHGPGDVPGEEFELDDEEVQLLLDLYRLYPRGHDRAGRRVVGRGMYSRAKGCRKSELWM